MTTPVRIWLPVGHPQSGANYPVVYVDGFAALDRGDWALALDHLVGHRVEEVIVVFIDSAETADDAYETLLAETVFPYVDRHYPTVAEAEGRALVAIGRRGPVALTTALRRQELIGGIATQSAFVYSPGLGGLEETLDAVVARELSIYMDWATYDLRNPHENWDIGVANRRIALALRERGFDVSGGEVPAGLGWANWSQRTDVLLQALFPKSR